MVRKKKKTTTTSRHTQADTQAERPIRKSKHMQSVGSTNTYNPLSSPTSFDFFGPELCPCHHPPLHPTACQHSLKKKLLVAREKKREQGKNMVELLTVPGQGCVWSGAKIRGRGDERWGSRKQEGKKKRWRFGQDHTKITTFPIRAKSRFNMSHFSEFEIFFQH